MVNLADLDYILDAHRERVNRVNRSYWRYAVSDSAESPMNAPRTIGTWVRWRMSIALIRAGERLGGPTLAPDLTERLATRGPYVAGGG